MMDKRKIRTLALALLHLAVVLLCVAQGYQPLVLAGWYVVFVLFSGALAVIERKSIFDGVMIIALSALFIWVGYELDAAQASFADNSNMGTILMMFPMSMVALFSMMYFTIENNEKMSLLRSFFLPWTRKN